MRQLERTARGGGSWHLRRTLLIISVIAAVQFTLLPQLTSDSASASPRAGTNVIIGADADESGTNWYPDAGIAPSEVNSKDFGQLYDVTLPPVDNVQAGEIYAQPIVADGVLLVVTENDNAYGLDPVNGAVEWSRNFGTAFPASTINCGDIVPNFGITGTPVVDATTGIAYFTTDIVPTTPPAALPIWEMQAVHMATGTEVPAFPVPIEGQATNLQGDSFDPTFTAEYQGQRPGLVYVNGEIYAAFGSHCDFSTWYGWIAGVSTSGVLENLWVDETSSLADGAGIWGPGGIVVDGAGNLYFATGNGGTAPPGPGLGAAQPIGLGECVVKLSTSQPRLRLADYFCPSDAKTLNTYDGDLGSGSPMALPPSLGTPQDPHLLVEAGKSGEVYLLDQDDLGGVDQGLDGTDDVVSETGPRGGVWSHPAVWPGDGGYVYITTASAGATSAGKSGELDVYQRVVSDGEVSLNWVGDVPGMPFGSSAPIVTSTGTAAGSGVVWEIQRTGGSNAAELVAYGATPVAGTSTKPTASLSVLWETSVGNSTKFNPPLAAGGRLYVGNFDGQILAFGPRKGVPPLSGAAVIAPDTVLGSSSLATATFTASGAVTVSGVSISVSTPGAAGAFSSRLPAPVKLTLGKQLNLPVSFDPKVVGGQQGTLTLTTNLGTVAVPLSGRGVPEGVPIAATPTSLDFGIRAIGSGVVQESVSFENTTKSPLTVGSVGIQSGAPAPFSVGTVPDPLPTLAPRASLSVPVDFTPPSTSGDFVQTFEDHLVLTTAAGEAVVPLSGMAAPPPQIAISSLSPSVGTVALGQSGIVSFTVGNRGGTPLTITKSKPPTAAGFSAVTSLAEGTVIPAHEMLVETVRFTPRRLGNATATWVINGDDSSGVQTVSITGTGAAEQLVPSPLQLGWHLSGAASLGTDALSLTPAVPDQAGAAFWSVPVPTGGLRASFTAEMSGGTGCNGLTFALVATSTVPTRPGRVSSRLGLAGLPAVGVGLQTCPNAMNPTRDSIGVVTSTAGAKLLSWRKIVAVGSSLRNVPVLVTVIVSAGVLTVEMDGFTVIDTTMKLPPHAYLGFTAATGIATDRHVVSAVEISYS